MSYLMIGVISQGKQYIQAFGGTVTTEGDYRIHTFLTNGTFLVTVGGTAEVIVAGGGGGGGKGSQTYGPQSGGGGAGGLIYKINPLVSTKK
jgi:hypothetical protein